MQLIAKRIFTATGLLMVLISAACSGSSPVVSRSQATPTAIPTPMVASKPTYTVQRGDIVSMLEFSGRVVPAQEEPLFFRTDGRVRSVYVKPGSLVTSGQVLADLISLDELEKTRTQDELNLRRAEINLEMARLRQSMAATRTPSYVQSYSEQMALQAYEVELAQISLQEQQLRASKVETAIEFAQITAPFDGRLLTSLLQAGDTVKAYETVAIVADDTRLEIGTKLISTQMDMLKEGMACSVRFSNRSDVSMTGQIRQMPYPYGSAGNKKEASGASGILSANDSNTRITVNLPAGTELKLSDILSVSVILDSKSGVLWLPPSAIRSFEGRYFVVVQSSESAPRRVDIKVGLSNEDRVEVVEGLEEGQVVIAP
jgi:membrane fusion protein, macrolide-specific efflux system